MIGCIVSNHTLLDRVKNENINIDEIIALAKRKEFDVRTDDLIYLYFVRDEAKCYIAFIYDPWEVFSATPLLKMLKVNYEDIANKIDLSLTL